MPTRSRRFVYLHGFASSAHSRKARFCSRKFKGLGIEMEIPDLAQANFENLTITAQLEVIGTLVRGQSVTLIGSSLGGYLASLYASRHPEVAKVVLLAPAFGFVHLWEERLGLAEMQRWEKTDQLSVYHYGDKQERNLKFEFIQDARQYPPAPLFSQPALILHGTNDLTVPIRVSEDYVIRRPEARLVRLESDHELADVLPQIWQKAYPFLFGTHLAK